MHPAIDLPRVQLLQWNDRFIGTWNHKIELLRFAKPIEFGQPCDTVAFKCMDVMVACHVPRPEHRATLLTPSYVDVKAVSTERADHRQWSTCVVAKY